MWIYTTKIKVDSEVGLDSNSISPFFTTTQLDASRGEATGIKKCRRRWDGQVPVPCGDRMKIDWKHRFFEMFTPYFFDPNLGGLEWGDFLQSMAHALILIGRVVCYPATKRCVYVHLFSSVLFCLIGDVKGPHFLRSFPRIAFLDTKFWFYNSFFLFFFVFSFR